MTDNILNNTENKISSLDSIQRFIFNDYSIRGELVQLHKSYQDLIAKHNYPNFIKKLLGELQVAITLITATLKLEGNIMLQIRGSQDSKLKFAYVNSNHNNETVGYASYNEDIEDGTLQEVLGNNAIMSVTVIPNEGQQYQGIIELDKETIAECLEQYYLQSMQIDTKIFIYSNIEQEIFSGLLLQVLPSENKEKQHNDFEHVVALAQTLTEAEAFSLESQDIIYRLYNQDSVNIFPNESICFKCKCSKEYYKERLAQMHPEDILEILKNEKQAEVECHACGCKYTFNAQELLEIYESSK